MMDYSTFTFPNGLRLIHKECSTPIAYVGLFVSVGSRHETQAEHGMAHLIEHLIFKGTNKRKAFHVLSRLEDVGGELNAFTAKEETCIQASFLCEYYERTIELLCDIVFNSSFPIKELEKEKVIIIDEINSYKDNPSETIYDDFEKMLYKGSSLGREVLGDPKLVKQFTREDVINFFNKHYHPDRMVLSSVGNIPFEKLKTLISQYFLYGKKSFKHKSKPQKLKLYTAQKKKVKRSTFQAHCMIGNVAYSLFDKRRTPLFLLNNILGGPCLNSRLSMSIREKWGLSYTIESIFHPYSDTGLFGIYFGTDIENIDRSIELIHQEMKILCEKKLGTAQLEKAKKQLIGQLAIAGDSNENLMLNMGKSFELYEHVDSFEETSKKINAITANQLQETAKFIFREKDLSQLIYY